MLWMRLVTAKNSPSRGGGVITAQRTSAPAPRAYATNERSISATPPPEAVVFTFQTVRPRREATPLRNEPPREPQTSAPSTSLNWEGSRGAIGTVCTCFIAILLGGRHSCSRHASRGLDRDEYRSSTRASVRLRSVGVRRCANGLDQARSSRRSPSRSGVSCPYRLASVPMIQSGNQPSVASVRLT